MFRLLYFYKWAVMLEAALGVHYSLLLRSAFSSANSLSLSRPFSGFSLSFLGLHTLRQRDIDTEGEIQITEEEEEEAKAESEEQQWRLLEEYG